MIDRIPLPPRRFSEVVRLNNTTTAQIGYYDDGRPGEVFVDGAKAGSDAEVNAKDAAVVISIALQYGVPVDILRHSVSRDASGTPQGVVGMVLDKLGELT